MITLQDLISHRPEWQKEFLKEADPVIPLDSGAVNAKLYCQIQQADKSTIQVYFEKDSNTPFIMSLSDYLDEAILNLVSLDIDYTLKFNKYFKEVINFLDCLDDKK
jgi:hypothetical protein